MQIDKFFRQILTGGRDRFQALQSLVATQFTGTWQTLVDGAAIAVDCALGNLFILTCANNNARVISVPTNMVPGDSIEIIIANTSGGVLTLTTFAAGIRQPAAITLPATGFRRGYSIFVDAAGTPYLMHQSAPDCAN